MSESPQVPPGTVLSQANKAKGGPAPSEREQFIRLSDIAADWDWNARTPASVAQGTESDSGGDLSDLCASLRKTGQLAAVVVRPNVHRKGLTKDRAKGTEVFPPYELSAGFRRFAAVRLCNEAAKKNEVAVKDLPNGTIRAVVRDLDDLQAKLVNGRENVRNPLEPPELMAHLLSLVMPPFSMKETDVAEDQGLSFSTVHKYVTVGKAICLPVLSHWRSGGDFDGVSVPKRASFEEIEEVSKYPTDKQPGAYKIVLLSKAEQAEKKDWFLWAEKSALRAGRYVARLVKEGVVTRTSVPWVDALDAILPVPAKARRRAREALAARVEEGFEKAMSQDSEEED